MLGSNKTDVPNYGESVEWTTPSGVRFVARMQWLSGGEHPDSGGTDVVNITGSRDGLVAGELINFERYDGTVRDKCVALIEQAFVEADA